MIAATTIERRARHRDLADRFAHASDDRLRAILATGERRATSLRGETRTITEDGARVFVKSIPLTDLERRPEHWRSTANLARLPLHFQYGIGSGGFGAWRELSAHVTASDWVVNDEHAQFPILHHWRVLPRSEARALSAVERDELERSVAFWGGSAAIRARLESRLCATADLALFLEYFPSTLGTEFRARVERDDDASVRFVEEVERDLSSTIGFMNARGVLHFDAHFENIVCDGARRCVTDFGLALSDGFELSDAERDFHRRHRRYDRALLSANLVAWALPATLTPDDRTALLDGFVSRRHCDGLPRAARAILARHAPAALAMRRFNDALTKVDLASPYPEAELARVTSG